MPQRTFLRGLRNDRRGGVLLIFAFAAIPLIFAVGMAIDYSRAMKTRTKLDAIADAAALYAVSAPMMELSDADAQTEATALFCSQAEKQTGTADQADESCSQIRSLPNASDFKLDSLTVTSSTSAGKRVASVSYVAESPNAFATVLGQPTLTVRGKSDTTNSIAPNMDFYFLLDTSMSMAYPTTTDGLIAVAGYNNSGCRFACHYSSFTKGKADPYMWAISQSSFDLRIDAEGKAVSQLFTLAKSMASKNNTIYRMNISTYGTANTAYTFTNLQKTDTIDNVQANYRTKVSPYIVPPLYVSDNNPGSANPHLSGDSDTMTAGALYSMLQNVLPQQAGTGINGDTPQAVLFIVTDGMSDEPNPHGASPPPTSGSRIYKPIGLPDLYQCAKIKARGIRIAILYTEYIPDSLTGDSWSVNNVGPVLNNNYENYVSQCASSPDLFITVSTDQSISDALATLFQASISSARITQ